MTTAQNATGPALHLTDGEAERDALGKMFAAAASDISVIDSERDFEPLFESLDLENPKASLQSHPGFVKVLRVLAGVVSAARMFETRHYEKLHYHQYIRELRSQLELCNDQRKKSRLLARIEASKMYYEGTPAIHSECRIAAKEHQQQCADTMTYTLKIARNLVGRWVEIAPGEPLRMLLADLDRLAREDFNRQLVWLGLGDFADTTKERQRYGSKG